jgi:uncharacterized protein
MPATVTLPALLALFKIDRDLHQLQVGLENAQKEEKQQQTKIARLGQELETQDSAHKKLTADIATRELEIKSRQEHIDKMRGMLGGTKTDKEYKQILVQISAEKAEVAKMETALLEVMQQAENMAKAIVTLKAQIVSEKQTLTRIEAQHGAKVAELSGQIAGFKAQREQAAKVVPGEALRQYERVSKKFPGDAMAPLEFEEDDLDTISCGSCFMGLNVEHLNALRSGRDEVRRCNSCNRILYLPEMLGQA